MPKHGHLKMGMMKTNSGVTPMIPWPKTKIQKIMLISDPLAAIIFARLRGQTQLKLFKFLKRFHKPKVEFMFLKKLIFSFNILL